MKQGVFVFLLVVLSAGFVLAADPYPPPACTVKSDQLLVLKVQQQACDVYLLTVQNASLSSLQKLYVDGGTICTIQQSSPKPMGSVVIVPCRKLILKGIVGETVIGTFVTSPGFNAGRLTNCHYME